MGFYEPAYDRQAKTCAVRLAVRMKWLENALAQFGCHVGARVMEAYHDLIAS
jgi:hypothetical protein